MTSRVVHVRCGSDIRAKLQQAGLDGRFVEFSDPVCDGPVPALDRAAYIDTRTGHLAPAYGLAPNLVRRKLEDEYQAIDDISQDEHVVIWCEHDPYDQLALARLLAAFAGREQVPRLELIAINRFPGIEPFFGLGQLSPEHLRRLWREQRRPVTPAMLERGRKVDAALCSPAADALQREADTNTPELPLMAPALRRYLRELPDAATGLGLTRQLTLELLAMHGPMTAGRLFKRLHDEAEPMPFLGDLMYWPVLHELAAASCPLIDVADRAAPWPQRAVAITETGRAVLAGKRSYGELCTVVRHVGGVRIEPGATCRRDVQ